MCAIDPGAGLDGDVMVPVPEDEAIWLGLEPVDDAHPTAVRVGVEGQTLVDAVTGAGWTDAFETPPQRYVVCPPQRALDGVQTGSDVARQLVRVAPDATGFACTGLRLLAIPPRRAPAPAAGASDPGPLLHHPDAGEAGAGSPTAGGVRQVIAPDPYGADFWQPARGVSVRVRLVAPDAFERAGGVPRLEPRDIRHTYRGWRLP